MLGIGSDLPDFEVVGVKPGFNNHEENGESAFENITNKSFEGKWKVIYFYPKDFTFVCPTEISEFASLNSDFEDRDCVVLGATFIVDPHNVIQHVYVTNLNVGRNPQDTLRVLDALQTDELCPCNRPVGGETL